MEINALIKTEKTVKAVVKDEEGNFYIAIDLFCGRCKYHKCEHTRELIEKLSIKS